MAFIDKVEDEMVLEWREKSRQSFFGSALLRFDQKVGITNRVEIIL